jgi:hypothetical protein
MSAALDEWRDVSGEALDEIELVHANADAVAAGSRLFTQQVNYVYATLITAHFQLYCRAIHTEVIQALVAQVSDPALAGVLEGAMTDNRFLDKGNPTPGNLGSDFGRFGFNFWAALEASDRRIKKHGAKLEQLCEWRNGIVHGDVSRKRAAGRLVPPHLDLDTCRVWRRSLGRLAISIDQVVSDQCRNLGCAEPW